MLVTEMTAIGLAFSLKTEKIYIEMRFFCLWNEKSEIKNTAPIALKSIFKTASLLEKKIARFLKENILANK